MTFSYSGDPRTGAMDALRFLIGDTTSTGAQFTDEELIYLLDQYGDSVRHAGLAACRRLVAKYSRCVDQRTGDIDVKYSQRVGHFQQLAKSIREGMEPTPYCGGISKSDIETVQEDDDRQGPIFALGMMDNPPAETDPSATGGTGGVL